MIFRSVFFSDHREISNLWAKKSSLVRRTFGAKDEISRQP
jgi:hypothetical protein